MPRLIVIAEYYVLFETKNTSIAKILNHPSMFTLLLLLETDKLKIVCKLGAFISNVLLFALLLFCCPMALLCLYHDVVIIVNINMNLCQKEVPLVHAPVFTNILKTCTKPLQKKTAIRRN